ncbi:MAG: FxsA family protein [Solirubrobacterales bacterium]
MLPLLLILFIAIPIAELWLIIQIGGTIGILPTLGLLIVDSLVGAALARSQSRVAWQRFNVALAEGRAPGKEAFDGAMIILGGALLLTPGFLTDAFGLILLIPPTRALVRGFITRSLARRGAAAFRMASFGSARHGGGAPPFPKQGRDYDYEGSASEVTEPARELDQDTPKDRDRG